MKNTVLAVVLCFTLGNLATGTEVRTWTSGKFTVEAELVEVSKDKKSVTLRRSDNGKEITLPLEKLSDEDRFYVVTGQATKVPPVEKRAASTDALPKKPSAMNSALPSPKKKPTNPQQELIEIISRTSAGKEYYENAKATARGRLDMVFLRICAQHSGSSRNSLQMAEKVRDHCRSQYQLFKARQEAELKKGDLGRAFNQIDIDVYGVDSRKGMQALMRNGQSMQTPFDDSVKLWEAYTSFAAAVGARIQKIRARADK